MKKPWRKGKRGVTPVIATILLISIVVVTALIILLWARGFIKEQSTKTISGEEKNIEFFCKELKLNAEYSKPDLVITNNGNVPVKAWQIKKESSGSVKVQEEPDKNLFTGDSITISISGSPEKIEIVPILRGKTKDGGVQDKICEEDAFEPNYI